MNEHPNIKVEIIFHHLSEDEKTITKQQTMVMSDSGYLGSGSGLPFKKGQKICIHFNYNDCAKIGRTLEEQGLLKNFIIKNIDYDIGFKEIFNQDFIKINVYILEEKL